MKKIFKNYLWIFEWIGAAILLAVGIFAVAKSTIFFYIVGIALIMFGLFRIIPLLKTTKDNLLKLIYTLEIILGVAAGIWLIMEGGKDDPNENLMRYAVGAVLYLRGALYFYGTVIRKETTDGIRFVINLVLLTLGVVIITLNFFTPKNLSWLVLVMAIISAFFISMSGIKNYKNFRYEQATKDELKKVNIEKTEKSYEAPSKPVKDDYRDPSHIKEEEEMPTYEDSRNEING